jgi:SAM-dependent methyltransferase
MGAMKPGPRVESLNRATMQRPDVVAHYARWDALEPVEEAVLGRLEAELRDQPLVDLGVGGGRTVAALAALSARYVGVDYSLAMVEACRRRFPTYRFEHASAREMPMFADASVKLVFFSCNGLGMVGHTERLQILGEVRRVLRPDGVFVFSNHNQLHARHDRRFSFPRLDLSLNPLKLAARSARFAQRTLVRAWNRARFAPHDVRGPEYSFINDESHDYATMAYYIAPEAQRAQLRAAGFAEPVEAFGLDGKPLGADGHAHDSIMYVARR